MSEKSELIQIIITKEGNWWRCLRMRRDADDDGGGEVCHCDTLEECFDFIRAHGGERG